MRILLAEDERALSNALVTILKHSKYSVDAVYNGQDALDYIENGNYDGVILDIMMPIMDGITVLKKVREKGNSVPILMLTAKSEVNDRVLGLDEGADDYLTKPFATKELLARIRSMTRRQANLTDNILTFANMELNRSTFEVSTSKGISKLSNKEFQMLEMLMETSNKIVATETFMEKIWGYDTDVEINVVWVYISYLRKKISSIGGNVRIKANRNLGYSLEQIS